MLRMSRCTQAPARQPLVRAGTGPSWLAGSVEFLPWAPGNGTGQTGGVCFRVGPGPSAASPSHGGGVPTHRTKAALDFKSEQTDEPKGGPGPGVARLQDLASPGVQSACP